MAINAIKGLGPALVAIYTPLLQWSHGRILAHRKPSPHTYTDLSVVAPA
ncbi:hypothetical protein A2U01_0092678, partial [Trifolium medium]|nr:hypothetical protein [Trifolium medium]